jgi:hypothetical protein
VEEIRAFRRFPERKSHPSGIPWTRGLCISALRCPKPRKEIRLRSYEKWSCGPEPSQEGLRREKTVSTFRRFGDREIAGIEVRDIEDRETPKPKIKSGEFTVECRRP